MPSTRYVIAMIAGAVIAAAACNKRGEPKVEGTASGTAEEKQADRIPAGGVLPPANALNAKRPANLNPDAGANLFSSMNCDGCHGGGGEGFVGPSLIDGRWRYGGTPAELYQTIFYGRPRGMPAYGGVMAPEGIWQIVTFLRSLPVRNDLTTERWKD